MVDSAKLGVRRILCDARKLKRDGVDDRVVPSFVNGVNGAVGEMRIELLLGGLAAGKSRRRPFLRTDDLQIRVFLSEVLDELDDFIGRCGFWK